MGMNFDLMRTQYENTHKRMIEGKCNARILRLNYDLIRKYDWLVFRNSDTLYHYLVLLKLQCETPVSKLLEQF